MRVAIGTTDGKVINQHFGHSPAFAVIDIDETKWQWHFVERRENIAACREGYHDAGAFAKSIQILQDCGTVFVTRIGTQGRLELERSGKQVLELTGYIDEVLEGYIAYLQKRGKPYGRIL